MRKTIRRAIPYIILCWVSRVAHAQSSYPLPSQESFINQVFLTVVDSNFSSYRLCSIEYPCSFVKFEYDEWVKYALREEVPVYVLNELAGKSFANRAPCSWKTDSLIRAIAVSEEDADSILDPLAKQAERKDSRASDAASLKTWLRLPPEARTVFYFSRPLFTDDGNYAMLDMDYRCDNRLCGMGSTCLFKRTENGWHLAGRKINWGSK